MTGWDGGTVFDSAKGVSLFAADMTATEIFDSVTNGGAHDFAEVVGVLDRNKPWCLIGGLAVNCFVEPVYTMDVDLVAVTANLEQIGRELEAAGFRLSSELNVQFTTDARYQDFLAGATEGQVLGLAVPVASLQEIVRGKVWAWQDKDRRSM